MKAVKRTANDFFTPEQKKVLSAEFKGVSEIELERFFITCERTGLDPFSRQIYGRVQNSKVPGSKTEYVKKIVIITSIDGLRSIAERTGEYRGQTAPEWYYLPVGGNAPGWYDVCPIMRDQGHNPLTMIDACRVGVKRKDFDAPVFGIANFDSFAVWEKSDDGKYYLAKFWRAMPEHMIAKVAEAQAHRKAFPVLTQGVYITEEVRDDEEAEIIQPPSRQAAAEAPLPAGMKYVEGHGPKITAASAAAASQPTTPKSQSTVTETPKPKEEPKPAPVKQETTAGEDKSPFGEAEEPKAPENPAPAAPVAKWQSHVIEHISVAKYHKKKLGDLTPDDIAKLKSSWVDKFADKIKANPSKQAEADMIVTAYEATK